MICQTASSQGMQRRRHAGSKSVSFFYKNKTLSRDSLGAGAQLAVPMSYSHKPPGKFCSVHHVKRHRNYPGSDTTTRMDSPIQGFFTSGALLLAPCPTLAPGCREGFARARQLEWRGWKTPPAAWEALSGRQSTGWAAQQGNPKAPPNPATLLMQKTTPHRPIF